MGLKVRTCLDLLQPHMRRRIVHKQAAQKARHDHETKEHRLKHSEEQLDDFPIEASSPIRHTFSSRGMFSSCLSQT